MAQDNSNELEVLTTGEHIVVPLSNKSSVTIGELTIEDLPAFVKSIKSIVASGISLDSFDEKAIDSFDEKSITMLALENTEELIKIVAVCSKLKREELNKLGIDDLIALASAIVEVNVDFFMKRILPLIRASMLRMEGRFAPKLGQEPSQDS